MWVRIVNIEPNGSHEGDGIAPRHRSGLHAVVELYLAVIEPVLEMDVESARREMIGHGCQGQIVRRDQSDGAVIEKAAKHTRGADEPIMRVGAVEQLIEQKQQRPPAAR